MDIRSVYDPLRRQVHVTITEDYFQYEGMSIEDLNLGIVPRALAEHMVRLHRGGRPYTVKQEMDERKLKNYLKRFPFLRLSLPKK